MNDICNNIFHNKAFLNEQAKKRVERTRFQHRKIFVAFKI